MHHIPTTAVGQAQLARRHQSSDKRGFGPGEEDGPGQGIYHYSVAVAKAQTTCSEETVHDVSVDVSGPEMLIEQQKAVLEACKSGGVCSSQGEWTPARVIC